MSSLLPVRATERERPSHRPDLRREPRGSPGRVRAREISVRGVVQGVGFRPFVHRLALAHELDGWVRNESGAVRILVQGAEAVLDRFLDDLRGQAPPLAKIDALDAIEVAPGRIHGFRVVSSELAPVGRLPVSPDVATCAACEGELRDPGNRRYRYPFITCTNCGPRFTVIESMPYDRDRSTMRAFAQCPSCLAEYGDPSDRRYHSETNSCPECGPRVWFTRTGAAPCAEGEAAIVEAARSLQGGQILAVRGLGGFHLAVDATDGAAVRRLRERKRREGKPLAVMASDLEEARRHVLVSPREAEVLTSPERPVVVLRRRPGGLIAPDVARGLDSVGVMLAYTPLHHLLLEAVGGRPLVMTSGNVSEEPIAVDNDEALRRLTGLADAFLLHDRDIVARYDDSVVRVVGERTVLLRRSRGYAPMPLRLPVPAHEPILAVGPHLKNTFTLADGDDAYVSQHVGDLENLETVEHFRDALARFETLFRIHPRRVVRDAHPGYLSTRLAEESGLEALNPVQHHHAHVAAVLAEHGRTDQVVGVALDGTGYGSDGRTWGCEFLVCDLLDFTRVAHLRYAPMPGGDRSARSPWRCLMGYASLDPASEWAVSGLAGAPRREGAVAATQIERALNAPPVSSMGRLFDAAAALVGLRSEATYEGQAAMELEGAAGSLSAEPLPFPLVRVAGGPDLLDPVPLLRALALRRAAGTRLEELAASFHESVARCVADAADLACGRAGVSTVVLGGGCFQNARLLATTAARLEAQGREVLTSRRLGPNDGAVSYGQAAVAAARLARSQEEGHVSRHPG